MCSRINVVRTPGGFHYKYYRLFDITCNGTILQGAKASRHFKAPHNTTGAGEVVAEARLQMVEPGNPRHFQPLKKSQQLISTIHAVMQIS